MSTTNKIKQVSIKDIISHPKNPNPRKHFDARKMEVLKNSIKREGIIQPLIVDKLKTGELGLLDGERRYRAATELKLKEVPVIEKTYTNDIDFLLQQYQVQEMHENWSAHEKAMAISRIAKLANATVREICMQLGLSKRIIDEYSAFNMLVTKEALAKKNLPIEVSTKFTRTINNVKKHFKEQEKPFTREIQGKLEKKLTQLYANGEFESANDFSKVGQSFNLEPKLIDKFITTKMTLKELQTKSKFNEHYKTQKLLVQARALSINTNDMLKNYSSKNINKFLTENDIKMVEANLKSSLKAVQQLKSQIT